MAKRIFVCVFIEPIIPMKVEENATVEKLPHSDDNKGNVTNR